MSSAYDIKKRIRSVSSTAELTRAMYLISTSRIRRAMLMYQSNRMYSDHARQAIKHILSHMPDYSHKYLKRTRREGGAVCFVVIASDRGMAGGYNHDVCAAALEAMRACSGRVTLITVGAMAAEFFRREGIKTDYEYRDILDPPTISAARRIMESITERMEAGSIDEAMVVYTHMINKVRQEVRVDRLLPLLIQDFRDVTYDPDFRDADISYGPGPQEVITALVPQYVLGQLYGMLVQSYASEHSKRMQAMDESTRNADELLEKLNLEYNATRQSAGTREITEIAAGAEAAGKQ